MSTNKTTVQVTAKHELTDDEKKTKLDELLAAIQRKEELDAEKKEVVGGYKNKIDAQDSSIKVLSNLLTVGYEHRQFSCYLEKNFDNGQREYFEVGSGKLIKTEPLTAADHQTQMDLEAAQVKANEEIADQLQLTLDKEALPVSEEPIPEITEEMIDNINSLSLVKDDEPDHDWAGNDHDDDEEQQSPFDNIEDEEEPAEGEDDPFEFEV